MLNTSFARIRRNFCVGSRDLSEFKIPTHPEVSGTHPEVSGTHPEISGTHPEVSGIGTSSAGVCIWPIHPLLASSSARPSRPLSATRLAAPQDCGRTGTDSGCVLDTSGYVPGTSGCVPDTSGCVGMRRDFEFQQMSANSGNIPAKSKQNLGKI